MPTDPAPWCIQDGPCLCLHTPGWPSPVPVVIRVQEPLSNHCHPFIWGLLVWTQNSPYSAANICPRAEKNKDMNTMATSVCKPLQFAKHFPTGCLWEHYSFLWGYTSYLHCGGGKRDPKSLTHFPPTCLVIEWWIQDLRPYLPPMESMGQYCKHLYRSPA